LSLINLFTNNCTSKLTILSHPNLHKSLADMEDEIVYCERKFNKEGIAVEEKILRIFKKKTNITFGQFYIVLLNMNIQHKSNYNLFCDYVRSVGILPYYYAVTGYPLKNL
jgi:hypothetical protein